MTVFLVIYHSCWTCPDPNFYGAYATLEAAQQAVKVGTDRRDLAEYLRVEIRPYLIDSGRLSHAPIDL